MLEEKLKKYFGNKKDARNEIVKDTDYIKTNNTVAFIFMIYKPCYRYLLKFFIINID